MEMEIERLGSADVSPELLVQLEQHYSQAFFNSHMYERLLEDLEKNPEVFQLFLAREVGSEEVLGTRVIESMSHEGFEYMGHRPIHGKRFCVHPTARGRGVGHRLIEAGKSFAFGELGAGAIFGESNEAGALAFHGREGALLSRSSIEGLSIRNSPTENLEFFSEFLANPRFRRYRFPCGKGVRFVYCENDEVAGRFEQGGHVRLQALLAGDPFHAAQTMEFPT